MKINVDTQTYPLAFTLPQIKTSDGAATHCKYNWDKVMAVNGNTFNLANSFTVAWTAEGQGSFTAYTANSNPWGRH
jgi:hypothetical protein